MTTTDVGIISRSYVSVYLGEGLTRHTIRIESGSCPPKTADARRIIHDVFAQLAADPSLSDCGPVPFEKMEVFHDGKRWIVTAEATEQVDD